MSMLGGFFKKTKHQKFEYKPRFYNPMKEDLMDRVNAAQGKGDMSSDAVKNRISNRLRRSYELKNRSSHSSSKKSTLMLLAITVGLVAISYYLVTVYLPVIEQSIGN